MEKRFPSLRLLAALALAAPGSCGSQEPATPAAPAELPPATAAATPEAPSPGRLDAFGNLEGSGKLALGFELPAGAEVETDGAAGPVAYVPSNAERLLRFYRSRGHQIVETLTGFRIEHTERTLARLGEEAAPLRPAKIRIHQGPGPGHTLRFDRGEPLPLAKTPLEALLELEASPAAVAAPAPAPEDPAAPATAGAVSETRRASRRPSAGAVPVLDAAGVDRLREEALRKRDDGRSRDVSARIYEWVKADPSRRFVD